MSKYSAFLAEQLKNPEVKAEYVVCLLPQVQFNRFFE